jgi:hypothetical protein
MANRNETMLVTRKDSDGKVYGDEHGWLVHKDWGGTLQQDRDGTGFCAGESTIL